MRPQQQFPNGTAEKLEKLLQISKGLNEYKRIQCIYFRAKSTVYRMLDRHNWRKITPRPSHPKSSTKAMEEFKKTSNT